MMWPRWNRTERKLFATGDERAFVWIGIDQPQAPAGLSANPIGVAVSTTGRLHARTLTGLRNHELDWHLGPGCIIALLLRRARSRRHHGRGGASTGVDLIETSSAHGIRTIATYLEGDNPRPRFLRARAGGWKRTPLHGYERVTRHADVHIKTRYRGQQHE